MKVYLVRHGQVPHNATKQYNVGDEDLTEVGVEQAKELREKIKNIKFDKVFSSPLTRAKHTAEIIVANKYNIIIDNRIEERSCGDLSGKLLTEINREEYWNYYTTIQQGTSENIQDFFKRIYNFLDELKTKDYKNVLVVAHSGVSKAFDGYFEGIQDGKFLMGGAITLILLKFEIIYVIIFLLIISILNILIIKKICDLLKKIRRNNK